MKKYGSQPDETMQEVLIPTGSDEEGFNPIRTRNAGPKWIRPKNRVIQPDQNKKYRNPPDHTKNYWIRADQDSDLF
jgi:hypothetical protein